MHHKELGAVPGVRNGHKNSIERKSLPVFHAVPGVRNGHKNSQQITVNFVTLQHKLYFGELK